MLNEWLMKRGRNFIDSLRVRYGRLTQEQIALLMQQTWLSASERPRYRRTQASDPVRARASWDVNTSMWLAHRRGWYAEVVTSPECTEE